MVNRIIGIIGSVYYVNEVEKGNKVTPVNNDFQACLSKRVGKVQEISKLNELNKQEQEINEKDYFKTEVVVDAGGSGTVVLMNNRSAYRQINLSGVEQQAEIKLRNPMKIKGAYFDDAL